MTLATLSPRELEARIAGDPVASRRLLRYLDDLGFCIRRPTTLAFAALCWGEPGWSESEAKTASKRWRDARATGELSTAARRLIVAVCWPLVPTEVEYRKTTHNGPLRRALLEVDEGWRLSNVARVADHAGSLRHYSDGWEFGDKTYDRREDAERNLTANGWEKWEP